MSLLETLLVVYNTDSMSNPTCMLAFVCVLFVLSSWKGLVIEVDGRSNVCGILEFLSYMLNLSSPRTNQVMHGKILRLRAL